MVIPEINDRQDAYLSQNQKELDTRDASRESVLVEEKEQRVIEADERSKEEDQYEDDEEEGDDEPGPDVERVISVNPSVNNVSSIPNGGLWAWLQVLGAFFLFFNSW